MFWQELKKTWKRPEIIIGFLLICVIQIVSVWNVIPENEEEYVTAYEKYGGQMNDEWKTRIRNTYEEYMSDEKNLRTEKEYKKELEKWGFTTDSEEANDPMFLLKEEAYYKPEFYVLDTAFSYTYFNDIAADYVKRYQAGISQRDAGYNINRIQDAYKKMEEQSDQFIFGNDTYKNVLAGSLKVLAQCVIMFLVLLLASLFTRERANGMDALLSTSRNGKRKLNHLKFAVCQSSALIVPAILIGLTAIVIGVRTGWQGIDTVVQDFRNGYNACPYLWNTGEYLAVIVLVSLITCQVAAAVIFVFSQYFGNTLKIICVALGVLLVPILLFESYPNNVLALYFSNFISGEYLWRTFTEIRIGQIYMPYWEIAVVELGIIFVTMMILVHIKRRRDEGFIKI